MRLLVWAWLAAASWNTVRTPATGPAHSIGGYSAGCIEGAVALPLRGAGFRVARPERGRMFGHPSLIAFIRELAARARTFGAAFLSIGDLSQPRGGPAPTGHASHQTGLDVDVWFLPPPRDGGAVSMVDAKSGRPSRQFGAQTVRLLEAAAADPRVDRIFVHPILKRALCEAKKTSAETLRKIRPWWGHNDHFHVRLACPPDSPACLAQAALPAGDGCSELDWWFRPDAQADREKSHETYSSRVGATPPELPEPCRALLEQP